MSDLAASLKKVPGITGVIAGGGNPCQGLSTLSSERRHLEDERGALFFKLAELLRGLKKECKDRKLWFWSFVENVLGDEKDIVAMSRELGYSPYLIDSAHFSRARRPRLFWPSERLTIPEGVEAVSHEHYTELICPGAAEPMEAFLAPQVVWEAGSQNSGLCFPTFTRAIPSQ